MFDDILNNLSASDPAIYLIIIIGLLIGSLFFLKKLFNVLIVILAIVALYIGWNYMNGNKIDVDSIAKTLSTDIDKVKDFVGDLIDKMTGNATDGLEKASDKS